ncbi:MAG: HipA domain-containing protein [Rhodospirillales bacterium]|nr:HipA domain-containing protein [Rhodospirillales bacterium]
MTFRFGASECFVYIMLPGQTKFVTAGRFVLDEQRGGPLGRFVYGRSYLDRPDALPIDPVELKLGKATYRTTALNGMFGALRDASPDYWGRRVIDKHAGKARPGEVDYLLFAPDDRAGALGFGLNPEPPAPKRQFNQTLDLQRLQDLADAIIADEEAPQGAEIEQVEELMLVGTSMGGARPKAVVEDDDGLWVAKFNRPDDPWNYARIEHAMLVLARACGIETAESKLTTIGDRDVLLVKRFDRERAEDGYVRARMISGLTLLHTEDTYQHRGRWSYILMAEELRRVSAQPRHDAQELFRRMCFNALISNTDDHPRNHALIARNTDWRLSPAYDLTPSTPVSVERRDLALACGDWGRYAHADNLVSQAARFHLSEDDARGTVAAMEERVRSTWYETARRTGVTERDCDKIAGAFAYPGFRLPLDEDQGR